MAARKPRLVVVSPFLDKRHGTERRVVEWISRLSDDFEIHVYSQRVEDIDLAKITWHRIPQIPGPHLLNFIWWFAANHMWRWIDRSFRGYSPDLVFTAGTNCLDADAVSVHIVFAEFRRQVEAELRFWHNPVWFWPRLLHRRLYYRLIIFLERHIYRRPGVQLILIARKTARDLRTHYGISGFLPVVYIGLDQRAFNPEMRHRLRAEARRTFGLKEDEFALVLVGNDWKKKGLLTLIDAMGRLQDLPLRLLVAGQDDASPYQGAIQKAGIEGRITFAPSRKDVAFYYAAADAYVGPSLEDTFAQPPAEAMACGLGVITSVTNGTAEIITDGVDGILIQDPNNAEELAAQIRRIHQDPAFLRRLGENAAQTARQYTWERNGEQMKEILQDLLRRRKCATTTRSS